MGTFDAINSFDRSFDIFSIMFFLVFGLVLAVFVVVVVRGISRWNKNNQSPELTVNAMVVTKRTDITHHRNMNDHTNMHTSSSTIYYATFQVESGDRIELAVDGNEYGMLAENDAGRLTFQGTRYKGFERTR